MGICLSRSEYQPFSRDRVSYCCGCLPWGNKNVPDYDYDESDDEMEFDTILDANTSSRYQNHRKLSAVWERIAAIFNTQRNALAVDTVYQSVPQYGSPGSESDNSIYLNQQEDAQILTLDQVAQITNNQFTRE